MGGLDYFGSGEVDAGWLLRLNRLKWIFGGGEFWKSHVVLW